MVLSTKLRALVLEKEITKDPAKAPNNRMVPMRNLSQWLLEYKQLYLTDPLRFYIPCKAHLYAEQRTSSHRREIYRPSLCA